MGFGNDAKKIYSGFGEDRGGDCCRCLVDSEDAKEICAGTSSQKIPWLFEDYGGCFKRR